MFGKKEWLEAMLHTDKRGRNIFSTLEQVVKLPELSVLCQYHDFLSRLWLAQREGDLFGFT